MPHTTLPLTTPLPSLIRQLGGPANHLRRWTFDEEENLLNRFRHGERVNDIATVHGRTRGAIYARLSELLGVRYPDTPEQYRRRGEPISRRGRTSTTPLPATALSPPSTPLVDGWLTTTPSGPQLSSPTPARWLHMSRLPYGQFGPTRAQPPVEQPNPEIPEHLEAAVPLSRKHFKAMAQLIRAERPAQEGRVAEAKHSTLNKLAFKLASLFEGENSTFDRNRWLEACGVTTERT